MAQRWPRWVYSTGAEPDYRFSFANERTFLAWIRTALALIAGGVAVHAIDLALPSWAQNVIAAGLVLLGVGCAVSSWLRWARSERAIRCNRPLPSSSFTIILACAVVATAIIVAIALG